MKHFILYIALLWLAVTVSGAPPMEKKPIQKALFQEPRVYLTISPEASYWGNVITMQRELELHWENFEVAPNDTINLFNENPEGMDPSKIKTLALETQPVTESSGSYQSLWQLGRPELNPTRDSCLGVYIAYIRTVNETETILKLECLRIYPKWMNDLRTEIGNTPLSSLMIPGTHNSGAWIYYYGWPSEGVLIQYTYCQDDTIYDQLINGIRSLDVRVGHYPRDEEATFWINHDAVRIRPLLTLLQDVRKFVLETNEIVFLDFHRFPVGFNDVQTHHELITLLQTELGDLLAPKSLTLSATPEQLWALNRTVVIFYSDEVASEYNVTWPGLYQAWADTNQLDVLESYLGSAVTTEGCKGKAWSLMAQLTSTVEDVLLRPGFGVRGYARLSNNNVSQWFERESWYSKSMVVALDYYRSTNVIETAIEVNKNHGNVCV